MFVQKSLIPTDFNVYFYLSKQSYMEQMSKDEK